MSNTTLNTPFIYQQKTYALSDTEGMTKAIDEDGYVLIPNVLSTSEVATAREALDRLQPFGLDGSSWSDLNYHFKCVFNRDHLSLFCQTRVKP